MSEIRDKITALEPSNDNETAPELFQPRRGMCWVLKRAAPGFVIMVVALLLARPSEHEARRTDGRWSGAQARACRETADFLDVGKYASAPRPGLWNQDCSATPFGNRKWRVTGHVALPTAETVPVAAELYSPRDDDRLQVCRLDIAGVEVFASTPDGGCDLLVPSPAEGPSAAEPTQGS